MSLFGSIRLASNALQATQVGLQVVAQNISNANTPGYIREEAIFSPAPTQQNGQLLQGLGVQVKGVVQKIDHFLEQRLRNATSDRASADVQEETFLQLEGLLAELGDNDLSTQLTSFTNAIAEVVNQPESNSVRRLAVLQADTLATEIGRLSNRVTQVRIDVNKRVTALAGEVNQLTEEIRTLNLRIASTEGGNVSGSDAVGLRDQRLQALTELSELVNIQVLEQNSGAVNVLVEGEYLVLEGEQRDVTASLLTDRGVAVSEIRFEETDSPVPLTGGELTGLVEARDSILGDFLDELDDFAATLINEFNQVFAGGQGLTGFTEVTGTYQVEATGASLADAGLAFSPKNGSFDVLVTDAQTGLTQTHTVLVDLDGLEDDTTLEGLTSLLDAIDGVTASITNEDTLQLRSDAANLSFAFADDSSGVLAALGVNTLFTGSSARDISINDVVADDPSKFTASKTGVGNDSELAVDLAAFLDRPLDSKNGDSILTVYDGLTSVVTQGSQVSRGVADGLRNFEDTLQAQKLAVSGVNIDEEAVRMITFQHSYQASARVISTLTELLDILVNL